MVPFTVAVCCKNSQDTIGHALDSAQWADEIIVVDSGSTDSTPDIARAKATRFVTEPWRGFTEQKKFAVSLARNEWVIVLDSDEEISPQLRDTLTQIPPEELRNYDVLHVRRRNYVFGRHARAWGPDWQSRVIHRDRAKWTDAVLHDDRKPTHPSRQKYIVGHIDHRRHSQAGFRDYFDGSLEDSRLLMVAQDLHKRGKRCTSWDLAVRPLTTFLKLYIFKLGFLDGAFGLLIAQKTARGTALKYAALWAVQNGVDKPTQPG
ncbi:MAG: glycosyltransferase [Phycisphaera sp.]|nr:glycosyltransferase [Phycisphaera sp.]